MRRALVLLAPLLVCLATPAARAAAPDTTWFGGTFWAADSSRWEAIPGGTWTFDSGTASALVASGNPPHKAAGLHRLMEGWTGWDLSAETDRPYFRRFTEADFAGEDAVCVGATGGLGGTGAFYAGALTPEAADLGFVGGRGYGNRWSLILGKTFSYPGSGTVTLEFDFVNETETGFDYTYVEVDPSGDGSATPVVVTQYEGTLSGHASFVLSQGAGTLPAVAGPFTVRFHVDSDASYSDEDGLYPTECGAFAVDNVQLSGAVTDFSDFESDDGGWAILPNPAGPGGDWSDIVAVGDVPDAPPGGCALADSVLVFYDRNEGMVAPAQYNVAVSPWIDLGRAAATGLAGRVIRFDVYQDFVRPGYVGYDILVQYRPVTPGVPGGFTVPYGCFFGVDPCLFAMGCSVPGDPVLRPIEAQVYGIPPTAEEVRFAIGAYNQCEIWHDCPGTTTNTTPYFDNIRFGVFDTTSVTTGIGDEPAAPAGLALELGATVLRGGRARMLLSGPAGVEGIVEVFDVAGRRVSRLYAGPVSPTPIALSWDGADRTGRPVSSGVYFIRAAAGAEVAVRRVLVAR